jgi:Coenzyme PQQ synthesis protein D (PqqD)
MYKVADTVRSTHSQDGAVVLDIRQGEIFNLNPVGSRILELLKNGLTEFEVIKQISQEFCVDREMVAQDVHEFVLLLRDHQLVVDTGSLAYE